VYDNRNQTEAHVCYHVDFAKEAITAADPVVGFRVVVAQNLHVCFKIFTCMHNCLRDVGCVPDRIDFVVEWNYSGWVRCEMNGANDVRAGSLESQVHQMTVG
jgi:hypothetical protein